VGSVYYIKIKNKNKIDTPLSIPVILGYKPSENTRQILETKKRAYPVGFP